MVALKTVEPAVAAKLKWSVVRIAEMMTTEQRKEMQDTVHQVRSFAIANGYDNAEAFQTVLACGLEWLRHFEKASASASALAKCS